MKRYTIIPIAKGLGKETLHYFGGDSITLGSLVSIPMRSKVSRGIVIEREDILLAKADIKNARFQLKKIVKVESKNFLSQAFLESAFETARYYATTTGSILQSVIPETILESAKKIPEPIETQKDDEPKKEKLVIQADDDERFAHYKSFIRGEFAKRRSVFFCLPTIDDIRQAKILLEKGIEQYTVTLHSGMGKKEFARALETITESTHPILIIGTIPFLALERSDLGSIILDRENSRGYRTKSRPYADLRYFVQRFTQSKNILLIMGDLMLSIESLYHYKNDEYAEFSSLKMRLLSPAQSSIIDMKQKHNESKQEFRIISPELEELLITTKEDNSKLFVFGARKGLSPSVVCGDCGTVVTCAHCKSSITLYNSEQSEPIFMCNKCGNERSSMERCAHCQSWKLQTLGIGVEKIEQEIKSRFPDMTVMRIDKDSVRTEKKALEIIHAFENTPGSVLIGTELGLFYLKNPIENVAVASIDSLFSVPDFRINEKIFYLLLTMRSRAEKNFLIQTRNASESVLEYASKGNLADFYRQEIADRKTFSYPPFSLFIKISTEGKGEVLENSIAMVAELLKEYKPRTYSSFSPSPKGNTVMHVLIRKNVKDWPDNALLEKLRSLSPQFSIRVDPESLL